MSHLTDIFFGADEGVPAVVEACALDLFRGLLAIVTESLEPDLERVKGDE